MSITRDPLRDTPSDRTRRPEERFRRGLVALLTEPHVDEIAITINGTVQVNQAAFDFEKCLIHVPAASDFPSSMLAQHLAQ
jgi:hypothetical protein